MTQIHAPAYVTRIDCDATGCDQSITPPEQWLGWSRGLRGWFASTGWSAWVGRSGRHYCPAHGPKEGHKMRQVST